MIVRERPADGQPAGALVLLHGRAADEDQLHSLLDELDPERRLHGFTPRGPHALPPGGAHWYAVPEPGRIDPFTFRSAYRQAAEWLDSLPHERLVLGGFAQGAVMALAIGLGPRRPRPAALVAFAGFVPELEGWAPDLKRPLPPVTLGHGSEDRSVAPALGRAACDLLERAGADVVYAESAVGHEVDPATVAVARRRIAEALA